MATRQWHYVQDGRQAGPVAEDVLRRMVDTGALRSSDLVWTDGFAEWQPAGEVPEFSGRSGAAAGPVFETENDSPYAAPMVAVTRAYVPSMGTVTYAGFWKRFVAFILDSLIVGIPVGIVIYVSNSALGLFSDKELDSVMNLIGTIVGWLYGAWMESSSSQATVGKMALGICVTDMRGQRISFGRALGRNVAKFVSAMLLLIGYIMAGFTDKKQALHDMMAGCLVVNKRSLLGWHGIR